MSQEGRKPRAADSDSDNAFDAKTVIRHNPAFSSQEAMNDENTKPGSSLDQAFGERTMVAPSRASGIPQPPRREGPQVRVPEPPPRLKMREARQSEAEPELEVSEVTQWNPDSYRIDVTNPGMAPIGKASFEDRLGDVSRSTKIIGGAALFLILVFSLTRLTGSSEGESGEAPSKVVAVDQSSPKSAEPPQPAVTPPQNQALGNEAGMTVEAVLQQFDHAFFTTQGRARGQ